MPRPFVLPAWLMLAVSLVALSPPLAWTFYLVFLDPVAPVTVKGKPLPADRLASWWR